MTIQEEAVQVMKLAEVQIKRLRYALEEIIESAGDEDRVIEIAKDALRQD